MPMKKMTLPSGMMGISSRFVVGADVIGGAASAAAKFVATFASGSSAMLSEASCTSGLTCYWLRWTSSSGWN
jgi:hypothetical protein